MNGKRAIWQISGGPGDRSYADVFLQHGVGLIGPGDIGPWSEDRNDVGYNIHGFLKRFSAKAQPKDIVLLRTGLSTIRAVGLIASEYLYLEQFDDVNGWDLQHARRVRWCELPADHEFNSSVFGANPTRFSRVAIPEVVDYARRFIASPPTHWQEATLPPLPEEEPLLDAVPKALRSIVGEVQDLHQLLWNRERFGEHPTEDELVGHFVLPLLKALGWPTERIAVKWRYVDVALFSDLPRLPEHCHLVVEAKRLGAGVEGALEQAKGYVEALGVPRDVMVTDGVRYRLYDCKYDFAPVAYANLVRLKQSAVKLFDRIRRP